MQIAHVIRFHKGVHKRPMDCNEAVLSVHGSSMLNKISVHVYALMFAGCHNVYCICVQRIKRGFHAQGKVAARRYTRELVEELK